MKLKHLYLLLCVLGVVIPYLQLVPWVAAHGFNLRLMCAELFATRIGAFFGLDVLVSAVVLVVFARVERGRLCLRYAWLPLVAVLCVGVSLGLPLLLYLREAAFERAPTLDS